MVNPNPNYYSPLRPRGTGNLMLDMGLQMGMNRISGNSQLPTMFPTGETNYVQQMDRMRRDREHQQLMEMANWRQQEQIGRTLGLARYGMDALNFQANSQIVQGFRKAGVELMDFVSPLAQQSAFGRRMADMAAGGNALQNLSSSLYMANRSFVSGLTGERASLAGIEEQSAGMHGFFHGGSEFQNRMRTRGFRNAELGDVASTLAQQGRLGGGATLRRALQSPGLIRGIQSGTITQEDLNAQGLGAVTQFMGQDMNDPEVQRAFENVSGQMSAATVSRMAAPLSALKELMSEDGPIPAMAELQQEFERVTSRYGQQVAPERIERNIRMMQQNMKTMGMSYEQMMATQAVAGNIAQQFGLGNYAEASIFSGATVATAAMSQNQLFNVVAPGLQNRDQFMAQNMMLRAAYKKSPAYQTSAIVMELGRRGKFDLNTPEGRRLAQIYETQRAQGELTPEDRAWMSSGSRGDHMSLLMAGTGMDMGQIQDQYRSAAVNRMRGDEYGLDAYQADAQAAAWRSSLFDQLSELSLGSLGLTNQTQGYRGDVQNLAVNVLQTMSPDTLKRMQTIEGQDAFIKEFSSEYRNRLAQNPELMRALAQSGDLDTVISDIAANAGDQWNANGALANNADQFLPEMRRLQRQGAVNSRVDAETRSLFTATVSGSMEEGLTTLLSDLSQATGEEPPEQLKRAFTNLMHANKGKLSDQQLQGIYTQYFDYRASQLEDVIADKSNSGGIIESAKMELKAVKNNREKIKEMLALRGQKPPEEIADDVLPEDKAAQAAAAAAAGGMVGPNSFTMQNVTINFGEDIAIQVAGAVQGTSPSRGTPNTR